MGREINVPSASCCDKAGKTIWGKAIHRNSFHKLFNSIEKSPDNDPSFLGKLSLTV